MQLTQDEKKVAERLLSSKEYVDLLKKVMLSNEDKLHPDQFAAKTNEELGEIIRADYLAEEKIKRRFDILKRAAQTSSGKIATAKE